MAASAACSTTVYCVIKPEMFVNHVDNLPFMFHSSKLAIIHISLRSGFHPASIQSWLIECYRDFLSGRFAHLCSSVWETIETRQNLSRKLCDVVCGYNKETLMLFLVPYQASTQVLRAMLVWWLLDWAVTSVSKLPHEESVTKASLIYFQGSALGVK